MTALIDIPRVRHYRDLRDRLLSEGFEILAAWPSKHLRLRVRRNGRETTVTCSSSPASAEHAINHVLQHARRGTR